ncbi:MAG: 16S rRNA (guanine(966)-N(2))-methyltransferase RsmD [Rhodospirillales bacterium]|nr:16S rRNA (guanine(966)-N(2))-methyltransferase RsmD [Rhodospirillales bacterium]
MRIIAGSWRGRALAAPAGSATRPTAERVRQALFDMLAHAPWARRADGRAVLDDAVVLDGFAGTGALGLEALSRGAANAHFFETDRAALAALRANIAACGAQARARVMAADLCAAPPGPRCDLVFLDPPYGRDLLAPALLRLRATGWLDAATLIVAETARAAPAPAADILAERAHGAARLWVWRAG